MNKLSILIPVFNEEKTIIVLLDKIRSVELNYDLEIEFIIIDDASTDSTVPKVKEYISRHPDYEFQLIQHAKNTGKGGCLHSGIAKATGDLILIQDADLEYDPSDYNTLLEPMMEGKSDVVFGSRFIGGRPHRILFFWHSIGNKILTFFSNMLTNLNLTDMENGFKLFRADILKSIPLVEKRFGFEPEITAKISQIPNIRIYEVGIAYYGRTYQEGKKINWKDGFRAVYSIIKYNFFAKNKSFQDSPSLFHYKKLPAYLLMALFFIAGMLLIKFAKGTGDEGDSIMHYLYARHSWQNPEFFFNHWAKPVFVLLASPFSQFGMEGMKFFNVLVSTLTLYLTYRTAIAFRIPYPWLAPLFMVFSPMLLILTLSGLTEPLFALWLVAGIYLLLKKKFTIGILFLSFLPFVRSEGLIVLSVLLVYLVYTRRFRQIPWLLAGHLVYALAGYYFHQDLLWVFNTMSYAVLHSAYGQGHWLHFIQTMPEVTGKAILVFLVLGLIYGALRIAGKFFFKQDESISNEEMFLVYGIFLAYFIGHMAFWALGIFNSFGLVRVMLGVLPLIALISARGFNLLASFSQASVYRFFMYTCFALILIYPFLNRTYSYNWKRDFSLKADQQAEENLGKYIRQNFPDYKNHVFYYEAVYMSVVLDLNYFDSTEHRRLRNEFPQQIKPGSFIVWDDWFAPVEGLVEEKTLDNDPRFESIIEFKEKNFWNVDRRVRLFRAK